MLADHGASNKTGETVTGTRNIIISVYLIKFYKISIQFNCNHYHCLPVGTDLILYII